MTSLAANPCETCQGTGTVTVRACSCGPRAVLDREYCACEDRQVPCPEPDCFDGIAGCTWCGEAPGVVTTGAGWMCRGCAAAGCDMRRAG
jgi:hypothetical protein